MRVEIDRIAQWAEVASAVGEAAALGTWIACDPGIIAEPTVITVGIGVPGIGVTLVEVDIRTVEQSDIALIYREMRRSLKDVKHEVFDRTGVGMALWHMVSDQDRETIKSTIELQIKGDPRKTEVRITDPDTGAQKGSKIERYDLIPVEPMRQVARHYGVGAEKYDTRNWEAGYAFSLSYAALQRHANEYWSGIDIDEETGSHHMAAVIFHALALIEFGRTHPEKDDRVKVTDGTVSKDGRVSSESTGSR